MEDLKLQAQKTFKPLHDMIQDYYKSRHWRLFEEDNQMSYEKFLELLRSAYHDNGSLAPDITRLDPTAKMEEYSSNALIRATETIMLQGDNSEPPSTKIRHSFVQTGIENVCDDESAIAWKKDVTQEKKNLIDSYTIYVRSGTRTNDDSLRTHDAEETTIDLQYNQNDIDTLWENARERGENKENIIDICNKLCAYIKNKDSGNILHVWPAYDSANKNNVQIIVITKEDPHNMDFYNQYATFFRRVNNYSEEANVVMEHITDNKITLSFEDSEKLSVVINCRAEELLKNHRYLSAITGSGIRSRGFSKGEHELICEVCIVLFVQTKGKIPLNETEFPEDLDGIPVDVMEGEFQTTCALATEYQSNLCLGCQIQSGHIDAFGTLGGFIEHPQYGLSAITCAHVVLDDAELHGLQRDGKKTWNSSAKNVYQPDCADENTNFFGKVKEATYKSGGNGTPGVDLAVIEVERRPPINGNCPKSNNIQIENLNFETGKSAFRSK